MSTQYVNEPGVTYTVISDNTQNVSSRVIEGAATYERSYVSEPVVTRVISEPVVRYASTHHYTTDISQWYTVDKLQRHDVQAYYRKRLERMFQKYDQSRLSEVSQLLLEHRDKEPTLLFDLVKQYGEEPADSEVLPEVSTAAATNGAWKENGETEASQSAAEDEAAKGDNRQWAENGETSAAEEPQAEEPQAEEPKAEEEVKAKSETPKAKSEEPKAEEEAKAEEPKAEEAAPAPAPKKGKGKGKGKK